MMKQAGTSIGSNGLEEAEQAGKQAGFHS